jgi:hypothetical protein
MATHTETLAEMAEAEWADKSDDERETYAYDYGFADEDDGFMDLPAAKEHFVDAWIQREWSTDFRYDTDPRV